MDHYDGGKKNENTIRVGEIDLTVPTIVFIWYYGTLILYM